MQVLRGGCMGRSRNPGDKPGLFRQVFEAAGEEQDRELILTTGSSRGDPGSAVPESSALALSAAGCVATDRVRRKSVVGSFVNGRFSGTGHGGSTLHTTRVLTP